MTYPINSRRIRLVACALAGFGLLALGSPIVGHGVRSQIATLVRPTLASDLDERQIIGIVLKENDFFVGPLPQPTRDGNPENRGAPRSIFLIRTSAMICKPPLSEEYVLGDCYEFDAKNFSPELYGNIPRSLMMELAAANRFSSMVAVPHFTNVVGVSESEVRKLLRADGWNRLRSSQPDVWGILQVSRTVISEDGSHALIYLSYRCGSTCGFGAIYLLTRSGNGWVISDRVGVWVS